MNSQALVVVAGSNGELGHRIVKSLLGQKAEVRALIRPGRQSERTAELAAAGAEITEVDLSEISAIERACKGADCVVSALAGLRNVIVDAQRNLMEGSLLAKAARFIPSDFSADYTGFDRYENRNLDMRRDFKAIVDASGIPATSILNGTFLDLLQYPSFPPFNLSTRTVTYWGSPDAKLDFTSMADIAEFTARACLDSDAPRFLRIVGDSFSARELVALSEQVFGEPFTLVDGGSFESLSKSIETQRAAATEDSLYPKWQQLMYMRTMFSGSTKVDASDNKRYPGFHWTSAREFLTRLSVAHRASDAYATAK